MSTSQRWLRTGLDMAVRSTWAKVGEGHPEEDRLPADGLESSLAEVNGVPAVVLTLPTPTHMAEVFSVVVAPLDPPTGRRYFTLELSWDFAAKRPSTVLAEWTTEGHTNFGSGPDGTDVDGMLRRIGDLLG